MSDTGRQKKLIPNSPIAFCSESSAIFPRMTPMMKGARGQSWRLKR